MSVLPAFDVYKEKLEDTREETRRRRSKKVVFDFAMYQIKFVGYLPGVDVSFLKFRFPPSITQADPIWLQYY